TDGTNWTAVGTETISGFSQVYMIGIAVTSHNAGATGTSAVDDFTVVSGLCTPTHTVSPTVTVTPTATPTRTNSPTFTVTASATTVFGGCVRPDGFNNSFLEPFWTAADIGAPAAGTQAETAVNITITAAGIIGGTSDNFRYIYQPVSGDMDVYLRVNFVSEADALSGAGLMMRQSLAANSPHASIFATYGNNYVMGYRATAGGATNGGVAGTYTNGTAGYVRLLKSGSNITGFYSADGVNWTVQANYSVSLGSAFYVGVAAGTNINATAGYFSVDGFSLISGGCTATVTPTNTPTFTGTHTMTATSTATFTMTPTVTPTNTPTFTVTQTITPTVTM
ncbi:MAG TPA: hypothetical protein P5511_10635, partial [Candidatus Goldiibacteriota bacterium]|nr:hypothetical protein [Candidatus Goldiibacteriota bacterium]